MCGLWRWGDKGGRGLAAAILIPTRTKLPPSLHSPPPPIPTPPPSKQQPRRASGTNLGAIRDQPPSGARVAFRGVSVLSFDAAGRILESAVFRQAPADEARYFQGQQQQQQQQAQQQGQQ